MNGKVITCDLVVVGSGGSGLVAVMKARNLSIKNVVVLEAAKAGRLQVVCGLRSFGIHPVAEGGELSGHHR